MFSTRSHRLTTGAVSAEAGLRKRHRKIVQGLADPWLLGDASLLRNHQARTALQVQSLNEPLFILNAILPTNQLQVQRGVDMMRSKGGWRVGVLGFGFKPSTDDLRGSHVVEVIEMLLGKGVELCIYDKNVNMAALTGANRDYILNHIPHISRIMVGSAAEVMDFAELVVVGNGAAEFRELVAARRPEQVVVDLVRIVDSKSVEGSYDGICW